MDRFALFATPVMVFSLEGTDELDQELTRRLIAESESTPGIQRSNNGGWHSVPDLSRREEPCYRAVMNMVVDHVRAAFVEVAQSVGENPAIPFRYAVQSWAMVMRPHDYTIIHDHAEPLFMIMRSRTGQWCITQMPATPIWMLIPARGCSRSWIRAVGCRRLRVSICFPRRSRCGRGPAHWWYFPAGCNTMCIPIGASDRA